MWLEVRRDIETGLRSGDQGRGGELSYSQHSEDCMNTSRDLPRTDKWRKPVQCDARLSAVSHTIWEYGSIQNLLWPGLLVTTRTRRNKRRESTSKRTRGVSTWRRTRGFSTWGRARGFCIWRRTRGRGKTCTKSCMWCFIFVFKYFVSDCHSLSEMEDEELCNEERRYQYQVTTEDFKKCACVDLSGDRGCVYAENWELWVMINQMHNWE